MNKIRITTLAVCAVMGFSAHAQNLLLNGSFELPAIPNNTFQRGTNTSWAWSGTAGFIINGNLGGGRPLPQDGQQYVDIGNSAAFVLSQNLSITNDGVFA